MDDNVGLLLTYFGWDWNIWNTKKIHHKELSDDNTKAGYTLDRCPVHHRADT